MLHKRLKTLRIYLKKSQRAMAISTGVHMKSWQNYELGKSDPRKAVFQKLHKSGVNINWLFTGYGEMFLDASRPAATNESDYCHVKVVENFLDSGKFIVANHLNVMIFRKSWLISRMSDVNNAVTLFVKSHNMSPTLMEGGLVLVDTGQTVPYDGSILALNNNDAVIFRRIRYSTQNKVEVMCDDPEVEDYEVMYNTIKILGQVTWYSRSLRSGG